MIPPQNYDEAKAFCCCQPYTDYYICIYAGGGSSREHDMYWGFLIYNSDGSLRHNGRLPTSCLDVDDGMRHCQEIIDRWNRGITYEDVYLWRAICEYLWLTKEKASYYEPTHPAYILMAIPECCLHLIDTDRTHRQMLWDLYTIQLIKWVEASKHHQGWCLKGGWEDKIHFLEQVYILGVNPNTLPRPWREKWEKKQSQQKYKAVDRYLKSILFGFDVLQRNIEWKLGEEAIRNTLQGIIEECREAKSALALLKNDE